MSKLLKVNNSLEELDAIRAEILNFIGTTLDPLERNRVVLSIDEALANVIEHASKDASNQEITLDMQNDGESFVFILEDRCAVFDPTAIISTDPKTHAQKGLDRGLGIYLYTMLMDTTHEIREGGGNRLILKKQYKN